MSIQVENLEHRFEEGEFQLRLSLLSIASGQKVAVVGPSGCGKTTLLQILAGILRPRSGRVVVDGVQLSDLSETELRDMRLRHVGLVFQGLELVDHLTVFENILLPHYLAPGGLDSKCADHGRRLACAVGIEDHLDRHPEALSRGERQRVAICRALVSGPELILADEPTSHLDPATSQIVSAVIQEEAERCRATLLYVTHDPSQLASFDDVIDMGMEGGSA